MTVTDPRNFYEGPPEAAKVWQVWLVLFVGAICGGTLCWVVSLVPVR